jgi:anion-transporting  ArsA/GET3 family ATPase
MTPGKPRKRATATSLPETLHGVGIAMVCGSGGVGKTSVAAAMAVGEAMRGRRVCVLTIDPARRLAQAMGLTTLDDRERRVQLDGAAEGGELHALMLDPKQAFDRLVGETARDEAQRERVLNNRIYQNVGAAAGMQEYMALERLYELDRSGKYDLIVVDTPPTQHARDLLDAPRRMLTFLQGKSLRWFLKPGMVAGRFGLKMIGGSNGLVVGTLQKVTGVEMLRDATEFFEAFDGMYETIADRIQVVERLFGDPRTGFFVVTSPERESIAEAIDFWSLLAELDFAFAGTIVNRVEPKVDLRELTAGDVAEACGFDERLAETVLAIAADHAKVAARDRTRIASLRRTTGRTPLLQVPRMPRLVSDLDGLAQIADHLYA